MLLNLILDTTLILNDSVDTISQIGKNTFETAENTRFGIIAGVTFLVSIATLVVAIFTYRSQLATQNNTARMNMQTQRRVVLDITKHLYRNVVDLFAIRYILDGCKYTGYPSEIHMASMKIEIDNIKDYFFIDLKDEYLNNVLRIIRDFKKFNHSLSYYICHLSDKKIDINTKKEDLLSMMDQLLYLITCTGELAFYIEGKHKKEYKDDNYQLVKDSYKKIYDFVVKDAEYINEYNENIGERFKGIYDESLFERVWSRRFGLYDLDSFKSIFLKNVLIAMGTDFFGSPRIQMIKFPTGH